MKKLFNYFDVAPQKLKQSFINTYQRNSRYSNRVIRTFVSLLALPLTPPKKSIRYFFWGTRYRDIIEGLPKEEVCILGGPNQFIYAYKNAYNYIPVMDMWHILYRYLLTEEAKHLRVIGQKIEQKAQQLKKYSSDLSYLIVDNDNLPMHRSMIEVASKAHVTSINIQHGIFDTICDPRLLDGWVAEYTFALTTQQRELIVDRGVASSNRVIAMGFHSSLCYPKRTLRKKEHRQACFLGQPYEKMDHELGERYFEILSHTQKLCKENNIPFFYKPHPWEDVKTLPKWLEKVVDFSLEESFEAYDIFISLTSTALFEAAWVNRLSIQIYDPLFKIDHFSELERIITIEFNQSNFQKQLLASFGTDIEEKSNAYSAPKAFLNAIETLEAQR